MIKRLIEKMELHDKLNPKIWENANQLRPEVKEKLNEIVDQFILELHDNDIPIKILDTRLVGSNASFNYTENSDLDVHIVANFEDTSCDVPVLNLLYNYFKKNFNDKYEISIHGVPVELYIEDISSSAVSNGIYSLTQEKWIKFPEPIEIPDIDITNDFIPYENRYINIIEDNNIEEASNLIDELYLLRKDSISTDGEYGKGNLIFKEFRNKGYLDSLKQLLVDETAKELSLESLNESKEDNQKLIDYVGEKTANKFFKLKSRIKSPENDLYYWLKKDPIELEDFLDELESTKSKSQQRKEDKLGAELLYNKDGWKVYRIDTYEAAKYYGKGTKWCISGNYPGHEERGKEYFNNYLDYANGYYFIIHGKDKWAYLDINLDGTKAYRLSNNDLDPILWDAEDTGIAPGKGITPNFPEEVIDILPGGDIFFNLEKEKEIDEVIDEIEATGIADVKISSKYAISKILNSKDYKNIIPLIHTIIIQPDIKKVPWFENLDNVIKVIIKEGVRELGNSCFYECENLQEIYLPKSIRYIGNECFYGVKENCKIYYAGNEDNLKTIQKNNYWRDTYSKETGEIIHIPIIFNTPVPMTESLNKLSEANNDNDSEENLSKDLKTNRKSFTVYHGSDAKFDKFDITKAGMHDGGQLGKGIYFTNDKELAKNFGGIYIYTCKIYFNKPYILENEKDIAKYLALADNNDEVTNILKSEGYDGVILKNDHWYNPKDIFSPIIADQYVVFNPNQIKIIKTDKIVENLNSLFKKVKRNYRNNEFNIHSEQLNEAEGKGYHYGDLGKSEYRYNKYGYPTYGGRHTGGWGTGIYFVGTPLKGRKDGMGYRERPEHEIDLSPYNLLTPISNENAYRLHDSLLYINNWNEPAPKSWDEIYAEYDKMYDKVFPGFKDLAPDDFTTEISVNNKPVLEYIKKYSNYYPDKITEEDTEDVWTLIDIAQDIRKAMGDESLEFERNFNRLEDALFRSRIYINKDKLRKIVSDALDSKSNEAPSTLILKALGFDGVDTRHLSKDADGLSGLDNFGYGSVIFDLKESLRLNETTEETGRTVIKAILFHTEEKPKSPINDFQDFEQDGLYKLSDKDYIAFEKRSEIDPRGWGLIHEDIKDHYIIKYFPDFKENNYDEESVEFDNMISGASIDYKKHLYNDLYSKIANNKFSNYKNIIKKAIDEYFLLNEDYLTEDIEAMKPHYPNIPNERFQELIELDPTYKEGSKNAGTYGKWILGIANKNNGEIPNKGHVKDVLTRFETNKKNLKNKDISNFKSTEEIDSYLNDESNYNELSDRQKLRQTQRLVHNVDIGKEAELVYEDSNWEIWVPKTYEASCKLGRGTKWCTATTETDHYYNSYSQQGPLYININKNNPEEKYQFSFQTDQFMDKNDEHINVFRFLSENPNLNNFYSKQINEYLDLDENGNWVADTYLDIVAEELSQMSNLDYTEMVLLLRDNYSDLFSYYLDLNENNYYGTLTSSDIADLIYNMSEETIQIIKDNGYDLSNIPPELEEIIIDAANNAIVAGSAAKLTNEVTKAYKESIPKGFKLIPDKNILTYIADKESIINLLLELDDEDFIDDEMDRLTQINSIIAENISSRLDEDEDYTDFDGEVFNSYIQDNIGE